MTDARKRSREESTENGAGQLVKKPRTNEELASTEEAKKAHLSKYIGDVRFAPILGGFTGDARSRALES